MAEATDAEHDNRGAGLRTAVPKRVEGGDPRAYERRRIDCGYPVRDPGQRDRRRDDVIRVAAVEGDAGDLPELAGHEVSPAARGAMPAVSPVPADTDPLARLPSRDTRAERVDRPCDLVSRDAGIPNARPQSLLREGITVADTASLDLDADESRARVRVFAFDELEAAIRLSDLHRAHRRTQWQ